MSIYTDKKKVKKTHQRHLGHLKLSISEDSSALIVIIHEVRGLKRKDNAPNDTYVKLYLLPDPLKQTKEKTRRVKDRDPVFNEKFSFILKDGSDLSKRLHISVWNRDRTSRSEMIGCMSFLVGDLIGPNKQINGWYQLLDEAQGKSENILVPNLLLSMGSQTSLSSTASAPAVMSKTLAVTLVRDAKGYGFKVTPGTPVYVTEVSEGMPAHRSDLQVRDLILEVEGTNVTRANGDMVVNMIKKQRETLQLLVQRTVGPLSPTQSCSSVGLPLSVSQPYLSHSVTDPSLPSSRQPIFSSQVVLPTTKDHITEKRRSSTGGLFSQPMDSGGYYHEPLSSDSQWLRVKSMSREKMAISKDRLLPEVPEEGSQTSYVDQQSLKAPSSRRLSQQDDHGTSLHGRYSLSQPSFDTRSLSPTKLYKGDGNGRKHSTNSSLGSPSEEDLEGSGLYSLAIQSVTSSRFFPGSGTSMGNQPRPLRGCKISSTSVASTDSAYNTDQPETDTSYSPRFNYEFREKSPPMNTAQQYIHPNTGNEFLQDEDTVEWESLSRLEQKRQRAINSLIKCETEFCEELKKGIKLYLTPLSSGILSDNSHRTIFMNLDRMFDLSQYFSSRLISRSFQYTSSPGNVQMYIDSFAEVYYAKLDLLKQIFTGYLRNTENSRKEIAIAFMNPEFKRIVQKPMSCDNAPSIYSFVEAGSEYLPKMSRLMVSISYVTPLSHEDHQYLTAIISLLMTILPSSYNDLRQNWKSEISIMEKLQSTITFGSDVEPFDIMVPGRVLLHEEDIQIVERKKKRKVLLLLFSDILLITKRSGRSLTVLESPLPLQDMIVSDINCSQEEFQVVLANGSFNRLLRSSSQQAKNQWMHKLKERASGSVKTQPAPAKEDTKQKELKHELLKERRTPFKVPPPSSQHQDSPIRTLAANLSVTSGYPMSQPMGMVGLPSKFSFGRTSSSPRGKSKTIERKSSKPAVTSPDGSSPRSKRMGLFKIRRRSLQLNDSSPTHGHDSLSQPVTTFEFGSMLGLTNKSTDSSHSSGSGGKRKSKDEPVILSRIPKEKLQHWANSFDNILSDPVGIQLFEEFLRKECSQENIFFWKDCQKFKFCPPQSLQSEAERIYSEYISHNAPNLVNIDHTVRDEVMANMAKVSKETFDKASHSIYMLMQRDSYSRFIRQKEFRDALS